MKKTVKISIFLIIATLVLHGLIPGVSVSAMEEGELRGVWVATVINIDYPSQATIEPELLKDEAVKILDHAVDTGLNAVFLQVRPTSDAIYKSQLFPWSKYLTGTQGLVPKDDFDPLKFWIEEAHKRGIELHAWINPYRVTKKTAADPKHDVASLDPSNPARLHPDWIVKHTDGNLYYDPGLPEVRKLVIDGILEIINNYEVDGIHFDDYFYPGKDFNDKASYEKYGTAYGNISDWRRENVNILIRDLSKAILETSKNIRFGISPVGIWANKKTNPLGSDTQGMQAYYDQFADSRKWVKEGLIDYIAPQIYWNIGFTAADYSKLLSWWKDTVYGTGVDLYIGQAAYRAGNTDPASPWYGVAEIEKQLKLNADYPEVKGSIFFSQKSLRDNLALSAVIKDTYLQRDGSIGSRPLSVAKPSDNTKTNLSQFYLYGTSDPKQPLYLNGQVVENRSKNGYFGVLVSLVEGENIFTFSQGASSVTRVINREIPSTALKEMNVAEIPAASVSPQAQVYRMTGEKITLSCQAPIGAKVTVKIDGKNYDMKSSNTASIGNGIYADTFTYEYTIPAYKGEPRNIDLGAPEYSMNYQGVAKTQTAPAKIGVIMESSPFYAEVIKDVVDTYATPASSNGADYELYKGMVDYITGMTGDYIRLSAGQWVKKENVKIYTTQSQLQSKVKAAEYTVGEGWDTLKLDMSSPVSAFPSFDGTSIKLDISNTSSAVTPVLPKESLFSSVVVSKNGNKVQYIFTLKENQPIEGYHVEKTDTGLILNIKRPVVAKEGTEPLSGIMIMVDPGHGGSDSGAQGPLGLDSSEKVINLNTAMKLRAELEKLGATVLMTRTEDKNVSLEERLAASRNARPDMFISIHANSMGDNVDISKIDGFSVFYREEFAQPLSETVFNYTINTLKRNNKGIHNKNFYVTRGTWTPSILIESGFVPNPNEFEWLIDENEQGLLAKSMADAIVQYFSPSKSIK
ncbi:uncharacterized lipoprotein YddW (UPF0748 family)/N-acetylmuramoyl-L-alanine amidase [Anaerosolibacter carboniphilus]|uniref:Uncharacterized lipoprotein YddW (UPF0748 family)/N-acetylmuramoyl-L-alanine amidase n=1 Tax=Anaerosolibacter carboniphilus TaxID=1417629 RepID=A0A841L168_9FIRM|nr:N-acetylmuramoyl-L-alanine amidase [Anaerosolibacter carboniphilus]MBB6216115.1 uncharacterized lipoprotein YddW (UPF0748 family)/N-acetylmuramoyl-L-alanine amidase [Anaerosolibacter carboniphilus]